MGFSGRNGKGGFRSAQGVKSSFNKQQSFNNNNGRGGNFRRGEALSDGLDRATSRSIAAAFGITRPTRPFRRDWGGNNRGNDRSASRVNLMRTKSGSNKGKGGKRGANSKRGGAGRRGRGAKGKGITSVESLDKELETYMGPEAAKASLDQELEKYMAEK